MTVPNLLTIFRILLTPCLMWFLLERKLNQALVVFIIAGLTDGLDGFVARLLHQKSKLGAYLDPLADKLLLVSSFLLLGYLGFIPAWLVMIAVARDLVIVSGILALLLKRVPLQIKPTSLGKMTTFLQLLAVLLAMSSSLVPLPSWGYTACFVTTGLASIASGIQYWTIGWTLKESNDGRQSVRKVPLTGGRELP
jgi:cardiolipin synthase (CMP-forming)